VATGTPEEVAQVEASFTGQYIREKLGLPGVIKEALSLSDRLRT
jgi:hypothetical protein